MSEEEKSVDDWDIEAGSHVDVEESNSIASDDNDVLNKQEFALNDDMSSIDPPLVAATPLMDSRPPYRVGSVPRGSIQRIESVETTAAVAMEGEGDGDFPRLPRSTRIYPIESDHDDNNMMSSPLYNDDPIRMEQPQSVIAEPVYFDEISAIPDEYGQHEEARNEEKKNSARRKTLLILLLVLLCLLIGGGVGTIAGISRASKGKSEDESPLDQFDKPSSVPSSASLAPTSSLSPSMSPYPTAAPSCSGSFEKVASLNISGETYAEFKVSHHASTAIMTHRRIDPVNQLESMYFDTFDIESNTIVRNSVQHDILDPTCVQLSADGTRLAVSVFGYDSDASDMGGALLVYQRSGAGWRRIYEQATGGGVHGSVFTTAMDSGGFTFAIVAGVIGGDAPSYARVFRVQIGSTDLVSKGQKLVDSYISPETLVGLSGDGNRLFMYTTSNQVRVYDYDFSEDTWLLVGDPITWSETAPIKWLEISNDGETFLLVPEIVSHSFFVFQEDGGQWRTTELGNSTEVNTRLYYRFGAISGDGKTIAISESYYPKQNSVVARNDIHMYQERHTGWEMVDFIELPPAGPFDFQGISLDDTGSRLVLATQMEIKMFDIICDTDSVIIKNSFPTSSPAPSTTMAPTEMPTCVDSFELSLSIPRKEGMGNVSMSIEDGSKDQYVVSRDGSTLIVGSKNPQQASFIDTYSLDVQNGTSQPQRMSLENELWSTTISGNGKMLALGAGLPIMFESSVGTVIPFDEGGALLFYTLNGTSWQQLQATKTGGGSSGAVFDVAMSNDGMITAAVAGVDSGLVFISVYSLSMNGFVQQIGNTLIKDWFDANTTVGIVEDRVFVSSLDGFIRAYDFNGTIWQQVGDAIAHFGSTLYLPSQDKSIIITASPFVDMQIFEYQNATWEALDATVLNGFVSNGDLVSVSVWRTGAEILVTEAVPVDDTFAGPQPTYIAKRFQRGMNDVYSLTGETKLFHDGILETTQFTDVGNMVFVFNNEVAVYDRVSCGV